MLDAIVSVWNTLLETIVAMFADVTEIFWDSTANSGSGGLTFVGVMAVVMAGVAIILLVFNLIRSFLPMRG